MTLLGMLAISVIVAYFVKILGSCSETDINIPITFLQHRLERTTDGLGPHVNADKTEYMCFNLTGDISTLKGVPLKLMDKFTSLESSVSSTEKDINTQIAKV